MRSVGVFRRECYFAAEIPFPKGQEVEILSKTMGMAVIQASKIEQWWLVNDWRGQSVVSPEPSE